MSPPSTATTTSTTATTTATAPVRPPSRACVSIVINAPIERVWTLVSDPVALADFSPELVAVDRPEALTEGATFVGHNERDGNEWSTTCTVLRHEATTRFAFHAGDDVTGTTWEFSLRDVGEAGTQLVQSFDSLRLRDPDWIDLIPGRHAQLVEDMQATLRACRDAVEVSQ